MPKCPLHIREILPRIDKQVVFTTALDGETKVVGVCCKCFELHEFQEVDLVAAPDEVIWHQCSSGRIRESKLIDMHDSLMLAFQEKNIKEIAEVEISGVGRVADIKLEYIADNPETKE